MTCQNCGGEIRCIYEAHRGKTDCWAHVPTAALAATLWCPGRLSVAIPEPKCAPSTSVSASS